jgi:hypothetical protein
MECQTLCDRNELLVFRLKESERIKESLLPADAKLCPPNLQTIVGGHSVSGAAAFHALNNFPCRGTLVWIPFRSSEKRQRDPFVGIMCWVGISEAAMAAYQRSYQWNSTMHPESSSSCLFSHCVCADNGCPLVCGNQCNATNNRNAVADVALSLKLFVEALQSNLPSSKSMFVSPNFRLDRTLYRIYPFDNIAKVLVDKQEL